MPHLWEGGGGGWSAPGEHSETGLCFFELPHLTQHYFVLSFSLVSLIKYSAHLRETDLGNNVLGEMAAADILEALRARKTGRAFSVCVPLHLSTSTPSQMQRYLQLAPLLPLNKWLELSDGQDHCHRPATIVSMCPVICTKFKNS